MALQRILLPTLAVAGLVLAGCSESDGPASEADVDVVRVTVGAGTCRSAVAEAPAGSITFEITNDGEGATTFSFRSESGEVLGDAGEIGPGDTGEVEVDAAAGTYQTVCRAAPDAEPVTEEFVVTDG